MNKTCALFASPIRSFAAALFLLMVAAVPGPAWSQAIYTTHQNGVRIGTINPASGVGVDIGATGQADVWALAFDVDGTIYTTYDGYTPNAQLARIGRASCRERV